MNSTQGTVVNTALHASRAALKYLPEPASRGVGVFRDVMNAVKSLSSDVVGGVDTALSGDLNELMQTQIEVYREMQAISMVSNIEKSKHESKMAAIRNMRVS